RILRSAERTGVEAVTTTDAQILGVQHDCVRGGVEAVHRAHRRARRVGAVHACHRDRALSGLAIVDRDDAPAVNTPRHLVFVLAGRDASVAFDATVGVTEEFHSSHDISSLRRSDLAEGGFGVLHSGHRVVAVGSKCVYALAENDRISALRIFAALILIHEPAGEVERSPLTAFAEALGHESLHAADLAAWHLGAGDQDPRAILDAAVGGINRIDLDEPVLLQLCAHILLTGSLAR